MQKSRILMAFVFSTEVHQHMPMFYLQPNEVEYEVKAHFLPTSRSLSSGGAHREVIAFFAA